MNLGETLNSDPEASPMDHVFIYGTSFRYETLLNWNNHCYDITFREHSVAMTPTYTPVKHKIDLMNAFADMDPSQGCRLLRTTTYLCSYKYEERKIL